MTRPRLFAGGVLAAVLALGVALAPAAEAGWITQDGGEPIFNPGTACHDGLTSGFAWYQVPKHNYATDYPKKKVLADQQARFRAGHLWVFVYTVPPDFSTGTEVTRHSYRLPYAPTQITWDGGGQNSDLASPQHIHLLVGRVGFHYPYTATGTQYLVSTVAPQFGIGVPFTVQDCFQNAHVAPYARTSSTVTVVLKSGPGLRPSTLRPSLFRLRARGLPSSHALRAPVASKLVDVNGDGNRDLVLRFTRAGAGITSHTANATLFTTDHYLTGAVHWKHPG